MRRFSPATSTCKKMISRRLRSGIKKQLRSIPTETSEKDKKKLSSSLAKLKKLDEAGLLEAYILLARPDEGIAQDHPAFLKQNRDKLRRYVIEYVIKGGG